MKKRDRMMAMALAAVVTATSMPAVAFAEEAAPSESGSSTTTSNSDGGTTTTTNNADGSSSSTTTNADGSSSVTNTSAPANSEPSPGVSSTVTVTTTVTYNADGVQTGESTTKETVNTESGTTNNADGSVTNVNNENTTVDTNGTDTSNGGTTNTNSHDNYWQNTEETSKTENAPDNNTPGEPTGTGFADENSSDRDKFVSGFQEGTTETDRSEENGNNYSESMKQTDSQGRPVKESGYAGGGGGTFEEHFEAERTETEISSTEGEFTESETQPEDQYVEGEGFEQNGDTQPGEDIPSTDIPLESDAPLTGTVSAADKEDTAEQDMTGLYNAMVESKHNDVRNAAAADAGSHEGMTGTVTEGRDADGNDVYTSTFTNANGDTITKEVVVKKVTNGTDISFTTTTTLTTTPAGFNEDYTGTGLEAEDKYFADPEFTKPIEKETTDGVDKYYYVDDNGEKVYLNTENGQDIYNYAYGELKETDTEPVVTYNLPARPAPQDDTEPDADGHLRKYTVEDVYDEQGNLYGYRTITTIYNAAGEAIGGGESYLMGEKVITESRKEVEKTTTIDVYKQTTEVTERTVTRTVTESVVNYTLDDATRDMIVNWLGVTAGKTDGGIEEWNSIQPDVSEYSELDAGESATTTDREKLSDDEIQYIKHILGVNNKGIYVSGNTTYIYQLADGDDTTADAFGYCIDLGSHANKGHFYEIENVKDEDYYKNNTAQGAALDQISAIAQNGFWGTTDSEANLRDVVEKYLIRQGKSAAEAA